MGAGLAKLPRLDALRKPLYHARRAEAGDRLPKLTRLNALKPAVAADPLAAAHPPTGRDGPSIVEARNPFAHPEDPQLVADRNPFADPEHPER